MDFFSAVGILARRWPITLLGLFLAVLATSGAYAAVAAQYQAEGQYFLVVPPTPTDARTTDGVSPLTQNPYLQYGNLQIVSELLARRMNSPTTADQLHSEGATTDYLVDLVPGESPTMLVRTTGTAPQQVLHTYGLVSQRLHEVLAELQRDQGAPENTLITLDAIFEPSHTTLERGSKIRAAAAVGILGLAGAVLMAFLAEGVLGRRKQRLDAETAQTGSSFDDDDSAPRERAEPEHIEAIVRSRERPPSDVAPAEQHAMSMATAPAPTTTQPAHDSALRTMASSVMTSDADDVDESLYEPQRQAPPTRW